MRAFCRFIACLLSLLILCSCTVSKSHESVDPPSVTIETYNTLATTESTTSESTIPSYPEDVTTTTVLTEVTTVTTVPSSSSEEDSSALTEDDELSIDDFEIADYEAMLYANASVNVRVLPDADSDRVGHLDEGEAVEVTGLVSNGWYRINFKKGEYFVNGRYLSDIYEGEATTEATTITTAETTVTTTEKTTITTTEKTTVTTTESDVIFEIEDDEPQFVTNPNSYSALNYATQKAMWFAYLDIDAMLLKASEAEFTASWRDAMIRAAGMGCNTVYIHVRAFGDAYYYSSIYPFTAAYSGTLDVRPSYDPLKIMIDEAHKLGLSFHAWINPMRTTTDKRYKEMPDSYPLKNLYNNSATKGKYIVYDSSTEYYWLSPAYPAVRELICAGIAEIIMNYNVDAIHIDDYFYPTTSSSFDKDAFNSSGASDLTTWRREVVNQLVREMYSTVKTRNRSVLFGISPAGNITNNTDKYYADVITWCSNKGYMDYVVPQIYYNYGDKLAFDTALIDWMNLVTEDSISLVCGIAAYKVGTTDSWSKGDVLKRQTEHADSLPKYRGVAYYRYGSIFLADSDVEKNMNKEISNLLNSIAKFN